MCLVLIGWRAHPEYRLIVAANRDEFYSRQAESLRWWPEVPGLLAGRDLGATGRSAADPPGTWLGLARELPDEHRTEGSNRFATVTNVRNPRDDRADARSRGALLMDYLRGDPATTASNDGYSSAEKYVDGVATAPDDHNGYNVVVSDLGSLWWHSNRSTARPRELTPGFHGLSNGPFVTSCGLEPGAEWEAPQPVWPKVRAGLTDLRAAVASDPGVVETYFELLADRTEAPDDLLPHTGVPLPRERSLSARFIADGMHGTRVSTVLLVREDGAFEMYERTYGRFGRCEGEVSFSDKLELR